MKPQQDAIGSRRCFENRIFSFGKFVRGLLIFSYGLFTIAAQALLFREFITTFEGNDISVGIFFGSWLLWVGLGAVVVYKAGAFAQKLLENIELLFLCYLPAFVLQLILIIQARELAGIESYVLLPIRTILLLSIVVNAPVSLITGMLFPVACRWVRSSGKFAVSRVYIIEAAGSFIGGVGATVLLGLGVNPVTVFFILAFIVTLSVFFVRLVKAKELYDANRLRTGRLQVWGWALVPVCILLCLIVGADRAVMQQVRIIKWTRLLPKDALVGSFQTAQAEYLYGIYYGQWVAVREGSVIEALPDEAAAGQTAAIALCQNPGARRVLVVGSGLGLCRQFLRLPQIEQVSWAHCDKEYVRKVDEFLPREFKITDQRFDRLDGDIRSLLAARRQYYDIVMLNLPEATSSVLNRYYTLEFYRIIKQSLKTGGILAVRVAGGENIMGTELVNLGASTKRTIEKVFSHLVLTPGEDTWFIASDSEKLTGEPGILKDRFAAIEGAGRILSPEALFSVYLPDRAAAALQSYSSADLPEKLLINRDARPLTHLYSLLLAAKQSGAPAARFAKHLALAGPLVFVIPILVFVVLRAIYILGAVRRNSKSCPRQPSVEHSSGFDSVFLVFSTGLVGIAVVIVLMYLYQTHFGSLYLYIGIISSLFMVGLTGGALLISYLLGRTTKYKEQTKSRVLLIAVVIVHTLILAVIAFWLAGGQAGGFGGWGLLAIFGKGGAQPGHLVFAAAFALCGLCGGCYFPLAARQLADCGFESGQAGSKLETADHLGASAGGLLASLALVPVLGTKLALLIFVLLILANVPPVFLGMYRPEKILPVPATPLRLHRLGYVLFGVAVSVILCSNLLARAGARLRPALPQHAAQALAGQSYLEPASTTAGDTGRKINYFEVYETKLSGTEEKLSGYIFSSEKLAPQVSGFGGKINLAVYVDTDGRLIDFSIIRSNETPAYLGMLNQWRDLLKGHYLFRPRSFADVDAVTGATVSSKAILSALELSGRRFATQALGLAAAEGTKVSRLESTISNLRTDTQGLYLIIALAFTLIVIYHGGFWSRLAVLCFNLALGGAILNAQYSSEQIATLLSFRSPAVGLSGTFLLAVGIPILVILFGNIYCGYICPFGAGQELLGYIIPARHKPNLSTKTMQKARFVKYLILFVLIIVFFISRDRAALAAEPLIRFFNLRFPISGFKSAFANWFADGKWVLLIVAAALTGSLFYTRFWCRYLCPAGAFLSLLNKLVLLKRFVPAKRFGKCEFGLSARDQLDCLYCDRCRYETKAVPEKELLPQPHYKVPKATTGYFAAAVLVVAVLVSAVSVRSLVRAAHRSFAQPVVSLSSAGQPRNVDLKRIRTLIEQKQLSDQEAQFYKKLK